MKQILQISILMILLLAGIKLTAGTYSGGTGTSGDPYQIATLADLIELSTTSDDWASTVYFIQTAHIDATSTSTLNAGAGFSPIGNSTTNFQGFYDGQYHTITNLFINRTSAFYVSLFGVVSGATIQKLGIENCTISGYFGVGGLVGSDESSSIIINCFSTGSVIGLNNFVGGLVGINNLESSISSCYSTCSVSGFVYVGGLVGNNNYSSSITYSYSTGNVSCSGNQAGGLVGTNNNSSTISNCYSLGNVTRSAGTSTDFGGFCGQNRSQIINCYSKGSVTGNSWTDKGFVGGNYGGTYNNNFFDQTTSGQTTGTGATGKTTAEMKTQTTFSSAGWDFSTGNDNWAMSSPITYAGYPTLQWTGGYAVAPANTPKEIASLPNLVWVAEAYSISPTEPTRWSNEYIQTADINMWTTPSWDGNKGWTPMGNLTTIFDGSYDGQNHTISNLFLNRATTDYVGLFGSIQGAVFNVKNLGLLNVNITGQIRTGGLAGRNSGEITNCFSKGKVNGTEDVGGLVGLNGDGTISNSYSTVIVSGNYTNVGGLVGRIIYGSISKCYSTGNVSSSGTEINVGGLIGRNGGSLNNCYATGNVTVSGNDNTVGGLVGRTGNASQTSNCYSTGSVIGNGTYVGGLVGRNTGSVNNCFWDTETSGKTTSAGGTGKTTAEMKTQGTFTTSPADWDFTANTGIWKIESSTYISYPYLQAITYDAPGATALGNPIPGLENSPCANPTDGGEIGSNQTINICEIPDELTSIEGASGYGGTLEYQWQESTTSGTIGFSNISGATQSTYQPEALNETTWYRRLARVSCKTDWSDAVSSNVLELTFAFSQTIQIPQGWSYISSWLEPTDPNIVNIWADIVGANNLAILTGISGIYAPAPFYINTLNNWDVKKGYKVKMNAADELQVNGVPLSENTVSFTAGVHLIPVLTNQTSGLDEVFNNPANDILYMLDLYQNLVYWPAGGINSLTELVPGNGYLGNFKNPVTLTYPPQGDCSKSKSQSLPPAEGPWPVVRTSNYHLISVSAEALNDLQNADYIGAFDSQGNCVGFAAIEKMGQNTLLTVYGDEPMTAENDGITEGELLRFRSFNINENTEKELTATFNPSFPNNDGLFVINGLSGITGFKESATGVGENELAASVLVYPNPATDVVNIVTEGFRSLEGIGTLMTTEGKMVKTFPITSPETQLDVSGLLPGVYVLKIALENQILVKRIVIL